MYHDANALCFSSNEHNSIIVYYYGKFYESSCCKEEQYSENSKKIKINNIKLLECLSIPNNYSSNNIIHDLKEYDNIRKIIGNPEYFNCLSHGSKKYEIFRYGKFYERKQKPNEEIFLKNMKLLNISEISVSIKNKESKYFNIENSFNSYYPNIIVTITSPHIKMPHINTIKSSIKSIKRFDFFKNSLSIIVADGIKPKSKWDNEKDISRYSLYKNNLKRAIQNNEYPFNKTVFIESSEWNGPTRNVNKAISITDSDTVFLNQHDLWFDEHKGVRLEVYEHLQEDKINKELDKLHDILTEQNNIDYIAFARYWEIVKRPCVCDKIPKIPYAKCCSKLCNGGIDHQKLYDEKRVKKDNIWWGFTNQDYQKEDIHLYSVEGISDAHAFVNTHFMKNYILKFIYNRNPSRFVEDIMYSALREGHVEGISDHLFLYNIFCCFHQNLQSKDRYLGQGMDRY